jgi:hypothetical protein
MIKIDHSRKDFVRGSEAQTTHFLLLVPRTDAYRNKHKWTRPSPSGISSTAETCCTKQGCAAALSRGLSTNQTATFRRSGSRIADLIGRKIVQHVSAVEGIVGSLPRLTWRKVKRTPRLPYIREVLHRTHSEVTGFRFCQQFHIWLALH